MNEDRAAHYHRLKRRSSAASTFLVGAVLVGVSTTGIATAMADIAFRLSRARPGHSSLSAAAIMALMLAMLAELITAPFAYYSGFVVEKRYGLAACAARGWLRDHVKSTVATLVLAVGGAVVIQAAMRWSPTWWWLSTAFVAAVLFLVLALVAPMVILPMFARIAPLERSELVARVEAVAERAGLRVPDVFAWQVGAKTHRANAALVGLGSTRRILLTDTLVNRYSAEEIEAILAHELAHHVHGDLWWGVVLQSGATLIALFVGHVLLTALGPTLGYRDLMDPAGLPLLALSFGGVSLALRPLLNAVSRWQERRADRYSLGVTQNPEAFVSALRRLGAQNLADDRPSRWALWLYHAHPPLAERVAAARAWTPSRS